MGSRSFPHRFYVMDTEAFYFVPRTDFSTQHPQVLYLRLQAPHVVHVDRASSCHLLMVVCRSTIKHKEGVTRAATKAQ